MVDFCGLFFYPSQYERYMSFQELENYAIVSCRFRGDNIQHPNCSPFEKISLRSKTRNSKPETQNSYSRMLWVH